MTTMQGSRSDLLISHLLMAVPLRMMAMADRGGPDDEDRAAATAYGETLAEHGDDLIFGGGDVSSTVLIADLVRAIAVLSFHPGGISIFGHRFISGDTPIYGRADACP